MIGAMHFFDNLCAVPVWEAIGTGFALGIGAANLKFLPENHEFPNEMHGSLGSAF
jgi:hypothetical protein